MSAAAAEWRGPAGESRAGEALPGEVADFDEEAGLGRVRGADGRTWRFHCTQIADGTRRIDVGARVSFEVVPGHLGTWEAARLRPSPA